MRVIFTYHLGDGLSVKVNDEVTHLEHLPYLNVWMKACINITDTCTHDSSVDLDISFHATNSEAGLDDITLSTSLCINGKTFIIINCQSVIIY